MNQNKRPLHKDRKWVIEDGIAISTAAGKILKTLRFRLSSAEGTLCDFEVTLGNRLFVTQEVIQCSENIKYLLQSLDWVFYEDTTLIKAGKIHSQLVKKDP